MKHGKSRFYCITLYATKGTIDKKSTKTENQAEAIRFAKDSYEDLIVKKMETSRPIIPLQGMPINLFTKMIKELKTMITLPSQLNNDKYRIENDLLPYFAELEISEVTFNNFKFYKSISR